VKATPQVSMRWLMVVGVLGAALAGCGAASDSGAPAATAGAVTSTPTPPTLSPTASVTPVATAPPAATPAPTPVLTPPPTSPSAPAGAPVGVALPNSRLTPGEAFPNVAVGQVCTSGYSSGVRHVEHQQYVDVYAAYGVPYPQPSGTYELDHLIALELGGDNSDANLWPEPASPAPGFHQKDDLENRMHDLVCAGRLDLHEAQREIASNWYAAYVRYVGA